MNTILALVVVSLLATSAAAQVGTEPTAWTPEHRALAGYLGDALLDAQIAATVVTDWRAWRTGDHVTAYRAGCSFAVALLATESLKRVILETRPDGSDRFSNPSGHSATTAALSGWNFSFGIPIAVFTGLSRANANKHHLWGPGGAKDIPIGWAIGAAAQAACHAVIH